MLYRWERNRRSGVRRTGHVLVDSVRSKAYARQMNYGLRIIGQWHLNLLRYEYNSVAQNADNTLQKRREFGGKSITAGPDKGQKSKSCSKVFNHTCDSRDEAAQILLAWNDVVTASQVAKLHCTLYEHDTRQ